jgi:hypothetical protein
MGSTWKVLPPGVHNATLEEVEQHFATNKKRKQLFRGMKNACKALKAAGCTTIYLDGSYVTSKELPNDYDVCWNTIGVNPKKLDSVFLDFSNNRKKQKANYGGEFFPSSAKADESHLFIQYFQTDKESGLEKGIICINL